MLETEKFQRLGPSRKQLVDTVKMIAYRAETALASIVREKLARTDDARSLLRDLFCSEADCGARSATGGLACARPSDVEPAVQPAQSLICWNISTRPQFPYPVTNLRLVYSIAGEPETPNLAPHQNPADQEV